MGTGWRRAFCTSIPRDTDASGEKKVTPTGENPSSSPSPRSCVKLGFFSNPSTPRLRIRTTVNAAAAAAASVGDDKDIDEDTPRLQCKTTPTTPTTGVVTNTKSPRAKACSNPSSPRTPSRFAILRSLHLYRTSCGICMAAVKTGQGTAIFTAECGHAFHFPCIAGHVRKQGCLSCPVCCAVWRHAPLLALQHKVPGDEEDVRAEPDNPPPPTATTGQAPKVYDDDEPLLPPRFNPIPEADEDEGEDGGEFQGFFVDPVSAPPAAKAERLVEALLPEAVVVSSGRSHESYAVKLRIKAPPAPPPSRGGRSPIDLVAALDVGRAMTDSKLQMLKRAVRLVVASLGPADRLSLVVAFPGATRRLLPLRRMTPKGQRVARRLVELLVSGPGVAAVSDSLRKAAKVLEDRRERNPVATILLLSDGQDEEPPAANHRQRHPSTTTRFAHVEIPVHSFGLGTGSNPEVLAKCVGGLLSVVVQDLRLHISFPSGEIPAVYTYTARPALVGGFGWVRLGDLYAEEERELLLELKLPAAIAGAHHTLAVKFAYRDPATAAPVKSKDQVLLVPRPSAARSGDPTAERLRSAFVAARAAAEARRLADRDDVGGAVHMLAAARALLLQSGLAATDENLRVLDGELAELQCRRQHGSRRRGERGGYQYQLTAAPMEDVNEEPLTPTSAWRAAEQLAKVAIMRKSMNRVSDLHGFENARF